MFTGIVECKGRITAAARRGEGVRLEVDLGPPAEGTAIGDSISISGVCLTVAALNGSVAAFDAVEETVRRTTLSGAAAGRSVNVERALSTGDRFGGHFVQGHVDGVATVTRIEAIGTETRFHFRSGRELCSMMIPRGSVAVDGISLTIALLSADSFACAVIPHTLAITTLGERRVGDSVNIETDLLGKWVARFLAAGRPGGLSEEFLREHGFS